MITYYKKPKVKSRYNFAEQAYKKQSSYYLKHPQLLISKIFISVYDRDNPNDVIEIKELKDDRLRGLKDWFSFKSLLEQRGYTWILGTFEEIGEPLEEVILIAKRYFSTNSLNQYLDKHESKYISIDTVESDSWEYVEELQFVCTIVKALQRQDQVVLDIKADIQNLTVQSEEIVKEQTTSNKISNIKQLVSEIKNLATKNGDTDFSSDIYNTIDVSGITDMTRLFSSKYGLQNFKGKISDWNVSNVKFMNYMFADNPEFNSDISKWNVSNVESMVCMFANSSFNGDIGKWNVSKVGNMLGMFCANEEFNKDINSWNVSNVKFMNYMFAGTTYNQNLSNWKIKEKCTTNGMFINSDLNQDSKNLPKLSEKQKTDSFNRDSNTEKFLKENLNIESE